MQRRVAEWAWFRGQALLGRAPAQLRQGAGTSVGAPYPPQLQLQALMASRSASTAAAGAAGASQEAFKPSPLSFVLLVPSVICGYLAHWQYERSIWKEDLIKSREAALEAEPAHVFDLDEPQEYQKVWASGRFVHERSIFVGPRPRSIPGQGIQSGYFLITPLYDPVRKGAVLVNRGWVPGSWRDDVHKVSTAHDAASGNAGQPAAPTSPSPSSSGSSSSKGFFSFLGFGKGKQGSDVSSSTAAGSSGSSSSSASAGVKVVGLIQPSEKPSAVLPDNVPQALEFHWVDVPTLAVTVGLPADTPLVQAISAERATQQQPDKGATPLDMARQSAFAPGGPPQFPIPKNTTDLVTFATMPKDHLIYSGIWTSLCVGLGLMAHRAIFYPPKFVRMVGTNSKDAWAKVQSGTEAGSAGQAKQ